MSTRLEARIQRLLDARKKCLDRCAKYPDSPRRPSWERKAAEYDESLRNFQMYGQETPPSGKPVGVNIDVPAGTFSIIDHAPEA